MMKRTERNVSHTVLHWNMIPFVASLLFALFITVILIPPLNASSFHESHTHSGKVAPFQPGDPKITLDKAALNILSLGKPYQTQIQSGTSGRGLVVQDIQAPTSIVWKKILDFDHYAQMVPKTLESKNYNIVSMKPSKNSPSQIIFTRMKIGFTIVHLEFFIKHLYYPALHSLIWTLDYTKKSDLDDSVGFWYVIPHPQNKAWSRVYYSVQVALYDWVPKFVVEFMSTKALTDATAWVKKFSELQYQSESSGRNALGDGTTKRKGWKFWTRDSQRNQTTKNDASTVNSETPTHIHITWTRIVLVSIVSALATFNIHLWLSK